MPRKRTAAQARADRMRRESENTQALRLWMRGMSYEAIGTALGVSKATGYRRVQAAIEAQRIHPDYEQYRAVQMAELEMSRRVLRNVIGSWVPGQAIGDVLGAIRQLVGLQEREAKLLGLDLAARPVDELGGMSDEELASVVAEFVAEFEGS